MRKFTKWSYTVTYDYGVPTYDVTDSKGTNWYRLMSELEVRSEKWVVGVNPDGTVSWWSDGSVDGTYAPPKDGDVVVCDTFDSELGLKQRLEGDVFVPVTATIKQRTIQEVEADVRLLLDELKALKEA